MGVTEPTPPGGRRIRARSTGLLSPVTRLPVFRIEDANGQVLRRISSARDAGEAMMHYWRAAAADARFGAIMSDEPPADATLRRRIDRVRAARGRGAGGRAAMQTGELPLPEPPPDADPADVETAAVAPRPARARRRPATANPPEQDLFAEGDEAVPPQTAAADVRAEPEAAPMQEPEPAPEPEPEIKPEPASRTVHHLDPQVAPLQPVDHRTLRPTDRADSFLYHVGTRAEADNALRNGLVVSAQDPVILTERPGVPYWLSMLAEDYDVIMDGPADFVVLRIRRHAVTELLEPDPDASRSAGCSCYLLTGGADHG